MNDCVLALKNKYNEPYIVLGGDFNRRNLQEATREYPDIKPVTTGPTRGLSTLDIIASNFNESIIDCGTLDSIFNEEDVASDHKTVFCRHRMPRVPTYSVQKYSYYHFDDAGNKNCLFKTRAK